MKAISIKQTWASLIAHGIKDIENRTWRYPRKYLGQRVPIHASGSHGKKFKVNKERNIMAKIYVASCWRNSYQ